MPDIDFEAARVAAAFGIESYGFFQGYKSREYSSPRRRNESDLPQIRWQVDAEKGVWLICIGEVRSRNECELYLISTGWLVMRTHSPYHGLMARGLYCLGIEQPDVLDKINYPLSAHERLELRLSLPQEFWPPQWHEEMKEAT